MSTIDISSIKFPDILGIREAALYLNMSEQYVRAEVRSGTLKATKNPESKAWEIKKADADAYKNRERKTRTGGTRGDGKFFLVKVPYASLKDVEAALAKFSIKLEPRYDYKAQKERKAKKAAAAQSAATPVVKK